MNRVAQDIPALRAHGSVSVDDLPCVAVLVFDGGNSVGNAALFELLGLDPGDLVNRSVSSDLLRQLNEISQGLVPETVVWVDCASGDRCALTVVSWNRNRDDDGCVFLLQHSDAEKSVDIELLNRDSELRYRTLFEESAEPIYIRIGKKTAFVSDSFVRMLGYESTEELLAVEHEGLVAPHHRERVEDIIRRREAGEDVLERYEVDLLGKHGQIVSTESFGRKIVWDGRPAVSAVFRDITEQKNNLQRIEQNAAIRRKMLDALPIGILVHDRGELLHVNNAFAQMLDFDDTDSLMQSGQTLFKFFVDPEAIAERSRARLEGDTEPLTYESRMISKHGREFSARIDVRTMMWEGTEVVLGSITDISDAVIAQKELQTSESRFRDYVKTAAHWFWEVDADGFFVEVSDGFEVVTGSSKIALIGTTRSDLFETKQVEFIENDEHYFESIKNHVPFADFKYSLLLDSGHRRSFCISGVPIFDEHNEHCGFRGTTRDITEELRLQEAIKFAATHDDLTGLFNRRVLTSDVAESLASAGAEKADNAVMDALCVLDLDGLKMVNDSAGHKVGDELIRQCAIIFRQGVRTGDVVARLGGDEFGILFRDRTRLQVEAALEQLLERVTAYRFHSEDQSFNVSFSAGVVRIDDSFGSIEDVFSCADLSCYASKERGRGTFQFYESSDTEVTSRRVEMKTANDIRFAIDEQRLVVHAQPIVSLQSATDEPAHYELLVRMVQRDGAIVHPGAFIRSAERFNLAPAIDLYVIENGFQQISQHLADGNSNCPPVTINVSGESLGRVGFTDSVHELFARYPHVSRELVCFEITETATIRNLDLATDFIQQMRAKGCSFALDDFGTGLSSFSYLKDLDVDIIKIDGVFVRDIAEDRVNRAVVSSICEVARSLDRLVVAECVEDRATVNMLTALGVDFGQGYVWARPVPFSEVLKNYRSGTV